MNDQEIYDKAEKIGDWACDCGYDEDEDTIVTQSNGGVEHLIVLDGRYYTVVTDWSAEGRVYPDTLYEVMAKDRDDFISKMIKGYEGK